jgi:hypothetical protein
MNRVISTDIKLYGDCQVNLPGQTVLEYVSEHRQHVQGAQRQPVISFFEKRWRLFHKTIIVQLSEQHHCGMG